MFAVLYEEKGITILMIIALVFSVFTRILLGILYQNMIRQSENMTTTNHRLLKQCKVKFSNCYQLNEGVPNVPIFVDKFINRLRIGPFSYRTLYHLSGQFMLLSVFFAGIGVCKCIIIGYSLGGIFPFYIICFLELYFYFAISAITDIKGRKRVLKTSLVDYLENHLVKRLRQEEIPEKNPLIELMPVRGSGKTIAGKEDMMTDEKMLYVNRSEEKPWSVNGTQESELEELLREFLTS